jgi:hypothetical protein
MSFCRRVKKFQADCQNTFVIVTSKECDYEYLIELVLRSGVINLIFGEVVQELLDQLRKTGNPRNPRNPQNREIRETS